jgi:hypothetical protein
VEFNNPKETARYPSGKKGNMHVAVDAFRSALNQDMVGLNRMILSIKDSTI